MTERQVFVAVCLEFFHAGPQMFTQMGEGSAKESGKAFGKECREYERTVIPSPIASHAPSRNSLGMDTRKGAVKASWKECGKECVKDNYFADSFQHFFKDVLQGVTPDVCPDTSRE